MARHRNGVLGRRERSAATEDLEADQARVRRRVEALEGADNGPFLTDGGAPRSGRPSDSSVTERSEATDEDVAAAVRALEERGHRLLPAGYYRR